MSNGQFVGLPMPVFSAFGFFSEETAVKYALEQMEQFVFSLHASLSREAQTIMPHRGLDKVSQCVYLARAMETDNDIHITFHAKPNSLRIAVNILDRNALLKAFHTLQKHPDQWMKHLGELSDGWEMRLQQMEYDPEKESAQHYKDLFKDPVSNLTATDSAELIDRMAYLNGEEKWLAPFYLTKRIPSEFISAMGQSVSREMAQEILELIPILRLLAGGIRSGKGKKAAPKTKKTTRTKKKEKATSASAVAENRVEAFTFNAKLKPLHIRKGFVNMTSAHWPFFSINSRSTTREIILKYDDGYTDRKSSVWRLVPNDIARLVLSDRAHVWLEDNCKANDEVQIAATKDEEGNITIELSLVEA